MDFKDESGKVPAGKIIPVYLTEEGDILPIYFHDEEELSLIGRLVAGILGKVVVNSKVKLNKEPIYIFNRGKEK